MAIGAAAVLGVGMLGMPGQAAAQGEVMWVANNNVGIGTSDPQFRLQVERPANDYGAYFVTRNNGAASVFVLASEPAVAAPYDNPYFAVRHKNSAGQVKEGANLFFAIQDVTAGSEDVDFRLDLRRDGVLTEVLRAKGHTGFVGFGVSLPQYPIEMASGAHVTAGGVWTDASSRDYKQDIADLGAGDAEAALAGLQPVTYEYKAAPEEHHVGFIAEDVPELVATKDRKSLAPMDVVAVLTKVVQEQQKTIAELKARVEALEKK